MDRPQGHPLARARLQHVEVTTTCSPVARGLSQGQPLAACPLQHVEGDHQLQLPGKSPRARHTRWHVTTSIHPGDHRMLPQSTTSGPKDSHWRACPLQHVEVTTRCSRPARVCVPGTPIGTCPHQHVEVTPFAAARGVISSQRHPLARAHISTSR